MDMVKYAGTLPMALIVCLASSTAMAQNNPDARPAMQSVTIQNCQSCHGPGGDSTVTTTPRLNGQQEAYMLQRLKQFSDVTRPNPHAKIGMFKELSKQSDTTRAFIAKYFAGQPPTAPRPGARAMEGKIIYENGIATENIIACNQCHGAQGEGHGLAPRIAGQHSDYLRAQLRLFAIKFRDHVLMNPNTKSMSGNTADALTSYLSND